MKKLLAFSGVTVAVGAFLLFGTLTYAGIPAPTCTTAGFGSAMDSAIFSIASSLGFATSTQTCETEGGYTYNREHEGMNAQYENAQGETLSINYCSNGAHVVTAQLICSSAPNSCGMVGTGFYTEVISAEAQVGSSRSACSAQKPSNSLCPEQSGQQNQQSPANGANAANGTKATGVTCSNGEFDENGTCVASCDSGYVQQNGACVFSQCPSGSSEGVSPKGYPDCVQSSCSEGYICKDGNLYHESSSCVLSSSPSQTCSYGCSGDACSPPPVPEIAGWQVAPTLVQSGQTVQVQWSAENVASCAVTGSNGDSWTGLSAATTSRPITSQTVFTILCLGEAGASTTSVTQSTTVNLVPTFQEQ